MVKKFKDMCWIVVKKLTGGDTSYGQNEIEDESSESYHDRVENCPKKDFHKKMIPISEFSSIFLPDLFKGNEEIYKCIKSLAYLTIRIKVGHITKSSLLCQDRGNFKSTSGTGRVAHVREMNSGKCKCRKCRRSTDPSDTFWTILICTASHVVFNEKRAEQTSCVFFHEEEKAEQTSCDFFHNTANAELTSSVSFDENKRKKTISLFGCRKLWRSKSGDLCWLEIDTCDKELANGLLKNIYKFNNCWQSLKTKYGNDDSSERHGGIKCVSIDYGIDKCKAKGKDYSRFMYSAATCSGSSGAPVYILGNDVFETEYVHSGTNYNQKKKKQYPKYANYTAIWYL